MAAKRKTGLPLPGLHWRGFTLQFFLITILPLTALLLLVAFGSLSLHHQAMRSLVGDRDLRAARAAARALSQEINGRAERIQLYARILGAGRDLSALPVSSVEIEAAFDGGLALVAADGRLRDASPGGIWHPPPVALTAALRDLAARSANGPAFSQAVPIADKGRWWVLAAATTADGDLLVGAFSPAGVVRGSLSEVTGAAQTNLLVVEAAPSGQTRSVLYQSGTFAQGLDVADHPGVMEALNGESGINYYQGQDGEHVVAFAPILPVGWALVLEESWEDIASPLLRMTQSAPLVLVPALLLALLALWYGARQIVQPLQELEQKAAELAQGNFAALEKPVGGLPEIRNLQAELVDMAQKLKAAQDSLHGYIGAITAGVENERQNLARELHDDTLQALIALNQRIQWVSLHVIHADERSSLEEFRQLVQQTIDNLRRLVRGLRPIYLEDLGLVAALEMLAREMGQAGGVSIHFRLEGSERRLAPAVELDLYRIAQEALSNVLRHAQARQAWVELHFAPEQIRLTIRDDGRGFIVPASPAEFARQGHFGLLGLQERAELMGARLWIASTPGVGTEIAVALTPPAGIKPGPG